MARPTQERLRGGPGIALDNNRAPALQVVAPLNVQAAPSGAELLAQSLGVALQPVQQALGQRIQREAADATSEGRAAGVLDKVDAKRQAEDASYAFGVKRAMVDKAVVDFKQNARTFYEEQFDKNQGTELLAQELDNIAKGMLGGYSGDADAIRWMLPEVQSEVARITGAHDQELAQQFKDERVASAGALIRDNIAQGVPVDPEEYMNRLRPVLGNSAASAQWVQLVGSLAVESRDPSIIDQLIPDKWADGTPGPRSVPALNEALNQSRHYAEAAQRSHDAELGSLADKRADDFLIDLTLSSASGVDPQAVATALDRAIANGLPITAAEARAAISFAESRRDAVRDEARDPVAMAIFQAKMITDPRSISAADYIAFTAQHLPPGKEGEEAAARLADDFRQSQNAMDVISKDPIAKIDFDYFKGTYQPIDGKFTTVAEQQRYYGGLRLYQQTLLETQKPEKAREATQAYFDNRQPAPKVPPSGDFKNDLKGLQEGRVDPVTFKQSHKNPGAEILRMQAAGEITPEQARAAFSKLRSK